MATDSRPVPWWLGRGTELCGHCLHLYHYQVEYRCTDCDEPICPDCVVVIRETRNAYCVECQPQPERLGSGEE